MATFTIAQYMTVSRFLGDKPASLRLQEYDTQMLQDLLARIHELPGTTTREYVTREAVWNKVEAELQRRGVRDK